MKKTVKLDFGTAFKYPFNRAKGMWNILWVFLPIVGWFALLGYGVRIVKEFSKGKFDELPMMSFASDLELGFMMFLKSLPFMIAYGAILFVTALISPWLRGIVQFFLGLFVVPMLTINFFNKETVSSYFEFEILRSVFANVGDYLLTVLKSILLGVIFFVMWIVLVGIPAGAFTQNIFMTDFYRRKIK